MAVAFTGTPRVIRREIDLTNAPTSPGVTTGAAVIEASNGPVNQRLYITSNRQFTAIFGRPLRNRNARTPQEVRVLNKKNSGMYSAAILLQEFEAMYFVRATDDRSSYANVVIKRDGLAYSFKDSERIRTIRTKDALNDKWYDGYSFRVNNTGDPGVRDYEQGNFDRNLGQLYGAMNPGVDGNRIAVSVVTAPSSGLLISKGYLNAEGKMSFQSQLGTTSVDNIIPFPTRDNGFNWLWFYDDPPITNETDDGQWTVPEDAIWQDIYKINVYERPQGSNELYWEPKNRHLIPISVNISSASFLNTELPINTIAGNITFISSKEHEGITDISGSEFDEEYNIRWLTSGVDRSESWITSANSIPDGYVWGRPVEGQVLLIRDTEREINESLNTALTGEFTSATFNKAVRLNYSPTSTFVSPDTIISSSLIPNNWESSFTLTCAYAVPFVKINQFITIDERGRATGTSSVSMTSTVDNFSSNPADFDAGAYWGETYIYANPSSAGSDLSINSWTVKYSGTSGIFTVTNQSTSASTILITDRFGAPLSDDGLFTGGSTSSGPQLLGTIRVETSALIWFGPTYTSGTPYTQFNSRRQSVTTFSGMLTSATRSILNQDYWDDFKPVEQYYVSNQNISDASGNSMFVSDVVNGNSNYIYIPFVSIGPTAFGSTRIEPLFGGTAPEPDRFVEIADKVAALALLEDREKAAFDIIVNTDIHDGQLSRPDAGAYIEYQRALGKLAATRMDAIAVVQASGLDDDTPEKQLASATRLNSFRIPSYVAMYAGFDKITDAVNNIRVVVPKCVAGAYLMARVDRISRPWHAPAGTERGVIDYTQGSFPNINSSEYGILYDNNINSSLVKTGFGNVMWGQKTAQLRKTALDRINVRRMLLYVENGVERILEPFILNTTNTPTTWNLIRKLCANFLDTVLLGGGIADYQVICDDTNNDLASNSIQVIIAVVPVRIIEYIEMVTVAVELGVSISGNGIVITEG